MQFKSAFSASSINAVALRNTWHSRNVETGMSATSIIPGMQIAFACSGVVMPVRRLGAMDLAGEILKRVGGRGEGVMTFDAFAFAGREARREYANVNMTRS
ncbi:MULTISPECIES: hypothetical protein [unclassified Paraburkholderia]|uniref:hypothetical protein n=1 Tax=unclassified Paraburkholderia TaxID=2615204 RepID=UPI002AB6FB99|nr:MULTISPECIES: hypothetical protein [unclassified Paraburkholderia]